MVDTPFFKKISFPRFSFEFLAAKPSSVVGIDIGTQSTKVVQLRYQAEHAILETYGELLNEKYFKTAEGIGGGFLRYLDSDIAELLKDVMRESKITSQYATLSIPASSSFITTISFPRLSKGEIEEAIAFEARKYIPIPISEVVLDWDLLDINETGDYLNIALVAIPREVTEKFKRIASMAEITLGALEVETFSVIRSLIGRDPTPTAIINIGHQATAFTIVDRGKLRASNNFNHGSQELTNALQRGLGVNVERAEALKREVGLSDRIEEREITSVLTPLLEVSFSDIERVISLYNRKSPRKIIRINITGGGSNLKGLVEFVASKFGLEVTRGNPFSRIVTPPFLQPVLREIGPSFPVAVGLALREIT